MKFVSTFLPVVALLLAGLVLAACDDATIDPPTGGDATIQGRVTDDDGFGKSAAAVEGATVTAAEVRADGSLRVVGGEATTDAQGRYTLDVDATSEVMVVTATKGDFQSRVLVAVEGDGTTRAMPMTTETDAEAEVYLEVEARDRQNESRDATAADVVALVNTELALAIASGAATATQVAGALDAAARTEAEFLIDAETMTDARFEALQDAELDALARLQAGLNVAANAQAQTQALRAFETDLIEASTHGNVSLAAQARARQTARAALVKFYNGTDARARFALRQQAEVLTTLATASAIEAAFEAEGSAQTRLDALAQRRTALGSSLRAATSEQLLANASAAYRTAVREELAAELGVDVAALATAEAALSPVRTVLDATLTLARDAEGVADAYSTFFASAKTAAETSLAGNAKAGFAAAVLTLVN